MLFEGTLQQDWKVKKFLNTNNQSNVICKPKKRRLLNTPTKTTFPELSKGLYSKIFNFIFGVSPLLPSGMGTSCTQNNQEEESDARSGEHCNTVRE